VSEDPRNLPGEPPPDPWPPGPPLGLGFGQNTPISTLPPVVALVGDESIPVVQLDPFGTPVTMRATPAQIAQTLPVSPGEVPPAFAQNQTIISGPAPDFSWTPVSFNELGLVSTWNGRNGDVTMVKADVTLALGFTPYDAANPQQFQTLTQVLNSLAASASNATPLINGTAAPGTSNQFARGDHVHPTDTSRYSTSNPSNFQTGAQVTASLAAYMPLAGGTFSGGVAFTTGAIFATPANLQIGGGSPGNILTAGATAGQVVWAPSGGGIPDAPTDGQTYGRNTATWVVVSGGGGVSDAPNDGTLYARVNPTWRHIVHTDITDWTATLAPYALTANVPVASTTLPIAAGTAAIGVGTTWARADHVHPLAAVSPPVIISATAPTSPVPGTLWWDSVGGQLYVWFNDGTSSQWVIAVNTGGGASISVGPAPPTSPASGNLWWDAVGAQLYVWFVDANSSQWVPTTNQMGGNFLPISGGTLIGPLASPGVTDGSNAAAGQVGEFLNTGVASGVPVTNITRSNVVSMLLQPGDWDVQGAISISLSAGTASNLQAYVGTVSNNLTPGATGAPGYAVITGAGFTTGNMLQTGTARFSLAAPTTIYLGIFANFTGGTCTASGSITARRAR
jgi:hypothetical protein